MTTQIKKVFFSVVFSLLLAAPADAGLTGQINEIVSKYTQKKVQFSIHVVRASSGKTLYSRNANKALIPASNMKIITTAAALSYLGPDYQYKTKVGLCGDNLVIIGSGDPLLCDSVTDAKYDRKVGWIFDDIAAKLKKLNITAVNDIIVDTTVFDDQRVHPNWPKDQLNRWYACEVSGLNFNANCIDITVENTAGKIAVSLEPQTSYVKIITP